MCDSFLGLYCGPMFSGKTSKLVSLSQQFDHAGIINVIINHSTDTRYTKHNEVVTHDKIAKECVLTPSLYDYHSPLIETDVAVFLINEGQFFPDIVPWTKQMVSGPNSKKVFISGLDADYQGNAFGTWMELVPFADTVEKLQSVCAVCKLRASVFSLRLNSLDTEQVSVGAQEYAPACRLCFEDRNMVENGLKLLSRLRLKA